MGKVKFSNIETKSNSKTQKRIPLVVIYHALLKSLSSIVNIYLLHLFIAPLGRNVEGGY